MSGLSKRCVKWDFAHCLSIHDERPMVCDCGRHAAHDQIFKAWVGEDAWVHKRWDKKGDMPGVTKEELSKMKLKY